MKKLIFTLLSLFTAISYADNNYSGIWKDSQDQFYSIHQSGQSFVLASLQSTQTRPSPFEQRSLIFSDNSLDLGIGGYGFFILEQKEGNFRYTRKGNFKVSAKGQIINSLGDKLITKNGGLIIPNDTVELVINNNGAILYRNESKELIELDRIKLASISPKDIQHSGTDNNTYKAVNDDLVSLFYPGEAGSNTIIQQGALESLDAVTQSWNGYAGYLVDNHVKISAISSTAEDSNTFPTEIYFNSESTASMKCLNGQIVCSDVELVKIF
jgi:flagellar basal body rod protein FlgF